MLEKLTPLKVVVVSMENSIKEFSHTTGLPLDSYDLTLCLKNIADIMCPEIRVFRASLDGIDSMLFPNGLSNVSTEVLKNAIMTVGVTMYFALLAYQLLKPEYTYIFAKMIHSPIGTDIALYVDTNPQSAYAVL